MVRETSIFALMEGIMNHHVKEEDFQTEQGRVKIYASPQTGIVGGYVKR